MQDSSHLPTLAEPLLQELGAKIEIQPVMNSEDIRKGLDALPLTNPSWGSQR
ncbi:hypothetical protein Srufu_004290 [Streptomyces libani subsp. rufus]|nr:hypothetical protein Srufu_004290 [Streptomyces libani subsp. rufus]